MPDVCSISPDPAPRKIIRREEVLEQTGLSKTRLYGLIDQGKFPRQVQLGARSVGWYEDEVQDWIRRRDESRGASDSSEYSHLHQGTPARVQKKIITAAPDQSLRTTGSRLPRRRSTVKAQGSEDKLPVMTKRAVPSSSLERIGTTNDGREMMRDPATGNLLVVIGHMPADWAS